MCIYLCLTMSKSPGSHLEMGMRLTCTTIPFSELSFRFALVYSNEPQRTSSSKVAHLMARLEALNVAPPGVLLPCLHADPSRLCLWVDCVPSTKLIALLEERLTAGYVPLVQVGLLSLPQRSDPSVNDHLHCFRMSHRP